MTDEAGNTVRDACRVESFPQHVVFTLRGELDAHDAPALRETFMRAIGDPPDQARRIVFDLSAVSFLDSSVIGAITGTVRVLRDSGTASSVVLPQTAARRIFEITSLDKALDTAPSREAALAG